MSEYLENEINKAVRAIYDQVRNKTINYPKIKNHLYRLVLKAYKEGSYCGGSD